MKHRRLDTLECRLLRPRPTCPCLLVFCSDAGETKPSLDVVCDRCGLRRDPRTTHIVEVIEVETREDVERSLAKVTRPER